MSKDINQLVLECFLPEDSLKWFNLVKADKTKKEIIVLLEEKNDPPLPQDYNGEKVISKGFHDITINDFPIRGRKTMLIYRRRYWQIEGSEKLLKRDIKLVAEGTQLEQEFADFLKK